MGAMTVRNDRDHCGTALFNTSHYKEAAMAAQPQQPGFRLLNSEVKPLTKELAEHFRDLEPSPTERELNPSRLAFLRSKADAGQLVTFHWATAKMGDKTIRVNGFHSSTMLCGMNGTFPPGLKAHVDEYQVETPDDLATLFRQFDARQSGRSPSDVSGAYQGLYEALRNVPRAFAKIGVEGVAWYRHHVEGTSNITGDDRYMLFGEQGLHGFLCWLGDEFSIKTPELKRVPIVGAMYGTSIANEKEAQKFWGQVVRGGVEFDDAAPSTTLDAWLKSLAEVRRNVEKLKPGNFYQGCIYAWNAFRENRAITAIKYKTDKGFYRVAE
jgi:hypothetical protein